MTPLSGGGRSVDANGALNGPLGLVFAPNGNLVAFNANNGKAVEVTTAGKQVATKTLVKNGAGDLFGAAVAPGGTLLFVNDGTNALDTGSGI